MERVGGVMDVQMRVEVELGGAQAVRREIDVVASTGSRLVILECKSGGWTTADLARLARIRDALSCGAWLVASQPRYMDDLAQSAERLGLHLVSAPSLMEDPEQVLRDRG